MAPAPTLPPAPPAQRAAASVSSSNRVYAAALALDTNPISSRGSNQQQLQYAQQQQLQQQVQQQQLLAAHGASAAVTAALAPLTAMAAPYASAAGIIKAPALGTAAGTATGGLPAATAASSGLPQSNSNKHGSNLAVTLPPSSACMAGAVTSCQGSANSSFFDADSVYETCCNSRASFLLPDDMETDAPFGSCPLSNSQQQQQLTPGSSHLVAAVAAAMAPAAAAEAGTAVTLANAASGSDALGSTWGLTPAAGATARSPLVSASTVAALMEEDGTPSLDLLQLDGPLSDVGPCTSPFACQLIDDDASEQLLSLCGPGAQPPGPTDVAGLFDTPDASGAAAAAVADLAAGDTPGGINAVGGAGRRGMVSLTASMAAAAALRRNQAGSSTNSPQQQQQQQGHSHGHAHNAHAHAPLMYRLVLLDGSTGTPVGSTAAARDAETQSALVGSNSPTCRGAGATGSAGGSGASAGLQSSSTLAAGAGSFKASSRADDTMRATGGAAGATGGVPKVPRARGRPKGSTNRRSSTSSSTAGVKAAAVAATAAAFAGVDSATEGSDAAGAYIQRGHVTGRRAAAMEAAAAKAVAAAVAAAGQGSSGLSNDGWQMVEAGSPAAVAADSGSAGDSSNESAQTQQQDDSAVKAAGQHAGGGKSGQRQFHHKGGGPCDHCGVLESPQWRRGPPAKPILCNACGTRYRRTHNLGPPIPSSGRPGGRQAGSGSSSSNGGGGSGRKRPAAAALNTPVPVNMAGGVHTGTRSAGSPAAGRRPVLKMARS